MSDFHSKSNCRGSKSNVGAVSVTAFRIIDFSKEQLSVLEVNHHHLLIHLYNSHIIEIDMHVTDIDVCKRWYIKCIGMS